MNFLEAFDELNTINEDLLFEKLWVAIKPKYIKQDGKTIENTSKYYKFLTLNDSSKRVDDIVDMLSVRNGTYKQSFNREVFDELKADLEETKKYTHTSTIADIKNFDIYDIKSVPQNTVLKILTKTDRTLRKAAQQTLTKLKNDIPELEMQLKDNKCLIHHINGNEEDNDKDNFILVPYKTDNVNNDDLKIARGIHSLLHTKAKDNIKTSSIEDTRVLYYFDESSKLKKGICTISVKL